MFNTFGDSCCNRKGLAGFLSLTLVLLSFTQGCMKAVRPPGAQERDAIHQGKKSVALLRFIPEHDAGRAQDNWLWISVANMDMSQRARVMSRHAPSEAANQKGWIYFLLDPGTYHLSVKLFVGNGEVRLTPDFWFHVPKGKPLVYIGSLRVPCKTASGLFSKHIARCSDVALSDEAKLAREIGEASFKDLCPTYASLMHTYSSGQHPAMKPADVSPTGSLTCAGAGLASPDWQKRALSNFTGIGDWMTLETVAGGLQNQAGAGLLMAYIFYLPLGTIIGGAKGAADEKRWKPCLEGLTEALKELDLASTGQRIIHETLTACGLGCPISLNDEAVPFDAASRMGIETVLQSEVQWLQIRECKDRGKFHVEMVVHARLWDVRSGRYTYNRTFAYPVARTDERPYEVSHHTWSSPCCEMDVYCKEGGREIFRREILQGLQHIAEMMCDEIITEPGSKPGSP